VISSPVTVLSPQWRKTLARGILLAKTRLDPKSRPGGSKAKKMAGGKKTNGATSKPRASGPTNTNARATKGAKRRAYASLISKKQAVAMTDEQVRAFWNPMLFKSPPPLRTSFGNYTPVNLVERWSQTYSAQTESFMWIPWLPSDLCALQWTLPSGLPVHRRWNIYDDSPPTSVRPLRFCFTVETLTPSAQVGGEIKVYSIDQGIVADYTLGPYEASGSGSGFTNPYWAKTLIESNPDTECFSGHALTKEHVFVSAPASYPGYNQYYDFMSLQPGTDGDPVQSGDMWREIVNPSEGVPYPFGLTNPTGVVRTGTSSTGSLGDVPPLRGFLVQISPGANAQTYRFSVYRQDGARYPVSTLGHTFSQSTKKMSASGEDRVLEMTRTISSRPAMGVRTDVLSRLGNFAHRVQDSLEAANQVGAQISDIYQTGRTIADRAQRFFAPIMRGARAIGDLPGMRGVPLALEI